MNCKQVGHRYNEFLEARLQRLKNETGPQITRGMMILSVIVSESTVIKIHLFHPGQTTSLQRLKPEVSTELSPW